MLALLPLLAFGLLLLIFLGRDTAADGVEWRRAFLRACLLWGGLVVTLTEMLSLGSLIARPWLASAWTLVLIILIAIAWRLGALAGGLRALRALPRELHGGEGWLAGCVVAVLAVLLAIALVSPPNNNDSLQYHMARVVHWAQSGNLAHYPTAYEPQLFNPVWAEMAILNFRVLWGDDRLASLIQWFSAVGCLIGVSAIAAELGAGRRGQWLAVAFALSIPVGVLQATSTQTDYVTGLWLICLAFYALCASRRQLQVGETFALGLALGLGMLTKGTFYPYAVPFMVWFLFSKWSAVGFRRLLPSLAIIGFLAVAINAGYWIRNVITFGGPFGPTTWVQAKTTVWQGPFHLVALVVRNFMQNFPTPSERVNGIIVQGVNALLVRLGDPPTFGLTWFWNHEDLAGSPIHMLAVPVVGLAALAMPRLAAVRRTLAYSLATLASFVCLAILARIGPFEMRYQLPFFVAWAPVVGAVFSQVAGRRLQMGLVLLCLLLSLPWVMLNDTRPVIGWKPRTATDGIFRESPVRLLFANSLQEVGPYTQAVDQVKGGGCKDVALRIDSHDPEYALWWLLGAPQDGTHLEVISYEDPLLARYVDPNFKPCAIICTVCGKRERLHGMPLVGQYRNVSVFEGPEYSPDPDN